MKKILVTGGAGFIGRHICKKHLAEGNKVYCLDNLSSGSYYNIMNFISDKNFTFIKHDVTVPIDIEVDEIYNFACPASPPNYQLDPIHTGMTSVIGAYNMLELALKYDAKIIQASTSEVYGDPLEHPQKENYWGNVNSFGIRSCYDEGKRMAETLFHDYNLQHGLDVRLIRIFNTYGPHMQVNDGRVVSNFINQALRNEDITIYGDGTQTRSFQYIDDLIDGLFIVMNNDIPLNFPINIGNPVEYQIQEIANEVINRIETKSKIVYKPLPGDDPKKRNPDIMLIKSLGFLHNYDLDKGLKETIDYFKSILV